MKGILLFTLVLVCFSSLIGAIFLSAKNKPLTEEEQEENTELTNLFNN